MSKIYVEFAPMTRDVIYFKLQRHGEKIKIVSVKIVSVTHPQKRRIIKKKEGFNKEGLQFEERMWTEGWTTVQPDGSFHAVTKALDNHTCESHVTGVYKTTYHHML